MPDGAPTDGDEAAVAAAAAATVAARPGPAKLGGYDFYRSIGSPRYVVAPMVDASELAWRILSRLHGAQLCYTPMIHSGMYTRPDQKRIRLEAFDFAAGEEGAPGLDRPLIAQFCGNDPETLYEAAKVLADSGRVDAVDINLGCPQMIAKKGRYGAFLMDDWDLIQSLISKLDRELSVPVTAKFRCYPTVEQTLAYASHLASSGAQLLTLHGRVREQKGHLTGLASWPTIRAAAAALLGPPGSAAATATAAAAPVPLFANGNCLTSADVEACLEATGAAGVMSAEGNLHNPYLFHRLNPAGAAAFRSGLPPRMRAALDAVDGRCGGGGGDPAELAYPRSTRVALEYLAICRTLKTRTPGSAVKAHLHRLWRPIFDKGKRHWDVRERLAKVQPPAEAAGAEGNEDRYRGFEELALELHERLQDDVAAGLLDERLDLPAAAGAEPPAADVPYSRCQPHFRPFIALPPPPQPPAPEPAEAGAGAADDGAGDDGPAAKRRKPEGVAGGGGGPARAPPQYAVVPCANPGCTNGASTACVRGACKACCDVLAVASAGAPEPPAPGQREGPEPEPEPEPEQARAERCATHEARKAAEREKRRKQQAHAEERSRRREEQRARQEANRRKRTGGRQPAGRGDAGRGGPDGARGETLRCT